MVKSIKPQAHVSKAWTEKRVQNLIKFFDQYKDQKNWSTRISKRMRSFSSDAIYKKASRMGLVNPKWATKETDNKGTKKAQKAKKAVKKGR